MLKKIFQRKKTIIPEWCNFFDEKEYNNFLKCIDKYFNKQNIKFTEKEGVITLESDNSFGNMSLGLMNIAQNCKQIELNNYSTTIYEHFEALKSNYKFNLKFNKKNNDFEYSKNYLAVRVYDSNYLSHLGEKNTFVGKKITEDLFKVLVFDLPLSVSNITPEQVRIWNIHIEDLFKIGEQNIKTKYTFDIENQAYHNSILSVVTSESFFTTNYLYQLSEFNELIGEYGSLISVPTRDYCLIHKIENTQSIEIIGKLIETTYQINNEGPGSLSNKLFWYFKGELLDLPYKFENNTLNFYPPEQFTDMLNSVSE